MSAIKSQLPTHKIGYWQGVPIFLTIKYLAENPYIIALADPYLGIELSCHPQWFEEGNHWRIDHKIEEFFLRVGEKMEIERAWITSNLQKAEEFEVQAKTLFPQHQQWQTALTRKQELDRYIAGAASAHSPEDLKNLAEIRHHLLETAPKELMERPLPKKTAMFVLPPRNPNVQQVVVETTRIEVLETVAKEQTIEEVVRTIQHSVIGSKATVSFGNLEHIAKKKKGKKGKGANAQPQSSAVVVASSCVSSLKGVVQEPGLTLWDVLVQESQPEVRIAVLTTGREPQQLTLL